MNKNIELLDGILDDPVKFIESCCDIVNKDKKKVPFILNRYQRNLINLIQDNQYLIIAKFRQNGTTSAVISYALWQAITQPFSYILLMSYKESSCRDIFAKLKRIYKTIPKLFSSPTTINNRDTLQFKNGSTIAVVPCSSTDQAHGATINFCHISEVALCRDSLENQLASIQSALTSDGKLILESTPQDGVTQFSEMFKRAEEERNLYKAVFMSWLDDINDPHGMHRKEQIKFSDAYIKTRGSLPTEDELDEIERGLLLRGYDKDIVYRVIAWRRMWIEQAGGGTKGLDYFNENFPIDSQTAFISQHKNYIFDPKKINEYKNEIANVKTIPKPDDLPQCLEKYFGKELLIWHKPNNKLRYYIGVDCSEGIEQDYTVVEIIDENGIQVCEYRTRKLQPYRFAEILYELASWFNFGMLIIERASGGFVTLARLREEYQYYNMYKSKDFSTPKQRKKIGYSTNSKTKPKMIDDFVEWFDNDLLQINSKQLLDEMMAFAYKDSGMEATGGNNDDTVMAMAMCITVAKEGKYYE